MRARSQLVVLAYEAGLVTRSAATGANASGTRAPTPERPSQSVQPKRSGLKNARTSPTSRSGTSMAAK